jgi:hypothetical protein
LALGELGQSSGDAFGFLELSELSQRLHELRGDREHAWLPYPLPFNMVPNGAQALNGGR